MANNVFYECGLGFTTVWNNIMYDKRMDFMTIGLYTQLIHISKAAKNWDFSIAGLAKLHKNGVDSVRRGIHDLEATDYLVRGQIRGADGTLAQMMYIVFPAPATPAEKKEALLKHECVLYVDEDGRKSPLSKLDELEDPYSHSSKELVPIPSLPDEELERVLPIQNEIFDVTDKDSKVVFSPEYKEKAKENEVVCPKADDETEYKYQELIKITVKKPIDSKYQEGLNAFKSLINDEGYTPDQIIGAYREAVREYEAQNTTQSSGDGYRYFKQLHNWLQNTPDVKRLVAEHERTCSYMDRSILGFYSEDQRKSILEEIDSKYKSIADQRKEIQAIEPASRSDADRKKLDELLFVESAYYQKHQNDIANEIKRRRA